MINCFICENYWCDGRNIHCDKGHTPVPILQKDDYFNKNRTCPDESPIKKIIDKSLDIDEKKS